MRDLGELVEGQVKGEAPVDPEPNGALGEREAEDVRRVVEAPCSEAPRRGRVLYDESFSAGG